MSDSESTSSTCSVEQNDKSYKRARATSNNSNFGSDSGDSEEIPVNKRHIHSSDRKSKQSSLKVCSISRKQKHTPSPDKHSSSYRNRSESNERVHTNQKSRNHRNARSRSTEKKPLLDERSSSRGRKISRSGERKSSKLTELKESDYRSRSKERKQSSSQNKYEPYTAQKSRRISRSSSLGREMSNSDKYVARVEKDNNHYNGKKSISASSDNSDLEPEERHKSKHKRAKKRSHKHHRSVSSDQSVSPHRKHKAKKMKKSKKTKKHKKQDSTSCGSSDDEQERIIKKKSPDPEISAEQKLRGLLGDKPKKRECCNYNVYLYMLGFPCPSESKQMLSFLVNQDALKLFLKFNICEN